MMSKGGGRRNGVTRDLEGGVREGERFGGSDGSVDGPRFKDLGGMDGVLEELKMEEAAKLVQPSFRGEGFSAIPNVKWEDVGGLHLLRHDFDRYIVRRIKNPKDYMGFGVDLETGFLLYGPPGYGKTLIAKAVANEAGANFTHIKGPEILNKYVGESEL
ncbi:hypothetical protein T459_15686 [Capsicum annuum]|uniref:ATPase AAA-type core domain-containing protein n=1 Tax=Capsicum annuum TaxID=4072 RepID=A0A2G2Z6Q2_CAPAN|nr:hypothetical protein T459_15686 [Capsicum annuum]